MRFTSRTIGDNMRNAVKRVTVEKTDDDPLFREHEISLYAKEKQKEIEHFEPYGFSSRVKKPTQEKGKEKKKAEGVMVFAGGQRSNGMLIVTGDRRYRMRGLAEGEVSIFDDQGQQVHFTRDGIVTSAPNGKKIVAQIMEGDKAPKSKAKAAKDDGQGKQVDEKVYASFTLTKDSLTVTHPKKIEHKVGSNTVLIDTGKIICQFGDANKSMRVDGTHTHIKHGGNAIFVDDGGCWSTVPIEQKDDPG